jgi:hypothetical protein
MSDCQLCYKNRYSLSPKLQTKINALLMRANELVKAAEIIRSQLPHENRTWINSMVSQDIEADVSRLVDVQYVEKTGTRTAVPNSDPQSSTAPLAAQKVSQPATLPPDSKHAKFLPSLAEIPAEHPSRTIRTASPETLKKWSQPVVPPSNSILSQKTFALNSNSQSSMVPLAAQKVPHPSPDSDHANSSPTLAETPAEYSSRAIGAAPPPETLKKWSRPVAPPSNSIQSQISALNPDSQPSIAPLAAQKVSQATSLSPDHANSANVTPAAIGAAPPPESLKKWSRPVALLSNSKLFLDSDSQPSRAPLAARNVSQPTSLPPNSDHANSSPTLVETPAEHPSRAIRTAPPPETLEKWSRPVTHHSSSKLSKTPVLDPDSQPSRVPLAAQKVSQPSSLSPDSDRAIRTAPPESLKRWSRTVAPPSISNLSQTSVPNSDSKPSRAQLAAWRISQRKINASQPTSLSPDTDRANQSLEKETPPIQDFDSLLDADVDEFVDEPLRNTNRRNQKGYEGRGRERIPSKVQQQSANTPVPKKKASSVPKLIKARRMDIYIPSALSVAALATLLNVKLGTSFLA